ncbi:MAG: RND transporter [Burkholderiales bacterium 28-67-8]|nr:MAG: RND transporter [Burkholderiales bacterium 28-67-8]
MRQTNTTAAVWLAALIGSGMANAQSPVEVPAQAVAASAPAATPMTDGEVRKVDRELGKITLRHGPITNLGMPGMTMVFKIADPALLSDLKEGDRVRFFADRINGTITVTAIEPVR